MKFKLDVPVNQDQFLLARRMGAEFHAESQAWYISGHENFDVWKQWLKPSDRIRIKAQIKNLSKTVDLGGADK